MKPESIFQKRVLRDLKQLPHSWILKTQEKTRRGVPDILMCLAGRFIAIELKASEKATVSPLQAYEIALIDHAGGQSYIAYPENWNFVLGEIKRIVDK
jgi:hypothetical protein